MPDNALSGQTCGTCSKNRQGPRVGTLLDLGPEAVLALLVLGELPGLSRVGLGILLLLVGLVLRIATNVSKEGIVGDGTEEGDRVKLSRAPEEEREGQVNKCVTKVAGNRN